MDMDKDRYSKTMTLHIVYALVRIMDDVHELTLERDGLQLMLNETRTIHKAETAALADCIRNGIERNHGSWQEWQTAARAVLRDNAPDCFATLDPESEVRR